MQFSRSFNLRDLYESPFIMQIRMSFYRFYLICFAVGLENASIKVGFDREAKVNYFMIARDIDSAALVKPHEE